MKTPDNTPMRWAAGIFMVSPLLTMTGYYLVIGVAGTVLGIGMGGGIKTLGQGVVALLSFLIPVVLLIALWRGYYRFFVSAFAAAPPLVAASLMIAAAGWWAGPGAWLLFFESDPTMPWIVLMFGVAAAWTLITVVAFIRYRRDARWTLLGAPFVLYGPLVFVLAQVMVPAIH